MNQHNKSYIVIGLGQTGYSCVKFLRSKNNAVCVVDTRELPPFKAACQENYPEVSLYCGVLPEIATLKQYDVVLSPGIAQDHPFLKPLIQNAKQISSDISLFANHCDLPIIAITGSNGKSTVTTLVGEMAKASGKKPAVIGNIGVPVLSILDNPQHDYDLAVMELSSFQLDITPYLKTKAATVLNISPDHLDRYGTLATYAASKHKIYENTECAVINSDDSLSYPPLCKHKAPTFLEFSKDSNKQVDFSLLEEAGERYLCFKTDRLLNVKEMQLMGEHNQVNALAALALGFAADLSLDAMVRTLRSFSGLEHRCQTVAVKQNIRWINDSKGTNVGASLAALLGLGSVLKSPPESHSDSKIILLLGGQGKGQAFGELIAPVKAYCRAVITMGENSDQLYNLFKAHTTVSQAMGMQDAVDLARQHAQERDIVLLSPACASLDQYQNFEHRGKCFIEAVSKLTL
ncbi:UDP-N-acetylmuramoyl-L-alanine--D-glutamate ligase [Candidatus Berkiella cookevillensis]|uniref:UDP-N-acetylmuramoylalanine--D-glutamate ligase n=1 Tax=Candidatus Berkiella cookevillensis TaxID=437022 RepID=A0A0Q9YQV3_9GAMM|nr:UDP-N-acetylmuramoyl-L-alanine--D-glutamate ligase [Candidatus Berkiella cookevillensis]MCS5708137.1 UDP-N-acetylmuramoyl-L-alanine--D-glutamate ligase [Candidatus Berkiella cookevillensis]